MCAQTFLTPLLVIVILLSSQQIFVFVYYDQLAFYPESSTSLPLRRYRVRTISEELRQPYVKPQRVPSIASPPCREEVILSTKMTADIVHGCSLKNIGNHKLISNLLHNQPTNLCREVAIATNNHSFLY